MIPLEHDLPIWDRLRCAVARRSARRAAKGDAGASAERRNAAVARHGATRRAGGFCGAGSSQGSRVVSATRFAPLLPATQNPSGAAGSIWEDHALFRAVLVFALVFAATPLGAVDPSEVLPNPVDEARARDIGKNLRCLVCQNQSIDDSDAQLARDLRLLVRERIRTGDSDNAVIDYVVSRYGDFVLLKPPLKAATVALWLGPAAIGLAAIFAAVAFYRRRAKGAAGAAPKPLTEAEKRRLAALLKDRNP